VQLKSTAPVMGKKDHSSRKRNKKESDDGFKRGAGVNYLQVSDRHVDDSRYERQKPSLPLDNNDTSITSNTTEGAATVGASAPLGYGKVSSQMEAVMRIMCGKEERTISEKLADSNRPTWEQYKKDNEDKLDITGVDQKKMEEYRRELDKERERKLNGISKDKDRKKLRRKKKRKRSKYDSSSSESRSSDSSDSEDPNSDSNDDSDLDSRNGKKYRRKKRKNDRDRGHDRERKRKHKKRSKSDKKKSSSRKSKEKDSDNAYRLSSFFAKGDDSESG